MRKLLATALALALTAAEARAAFDDVGVGARVTGLGNAFTAIADDAYAVYYNPAGLATMDRPMLATTYSRLLAGLSDNSSLQNSFLAYAHPLKGGRAGTLGASWNYFTLDDLYREMSLSGAYGRRILADRAPHGLYAGAAAKVLSRSLGRTSAADVSFTNTGQQVGPPDPVLQKGGKTVLDLDLGLLYRPRPRLSLGLAVQHLTEPDIALSDSDEDRLGRNLKLGAAYRTAWTAFSGELGLLKAPDGSTDKVFTLAVEKWLPTLVHGTFGVRGSVGAGSRDYRQLTAGLSYKIYRMQVDYSFGIPLGTISGTFGSHRVGLSFRFGRPSGAQPRFAEAVLENMMELAAAGTPDFDSQAKALAGYKMTAQREFLRQARVDTVNGLFAQALAKLEQALALNPGDAQIAESRDRMAVVAAHLPEAAGFGVDTVMAVVYGAVMDYLAGKTQEAVEALRYARTLRPDDGRLKPLLEAWERESAGEKPPEKPEPSPEEKLVAESLRAMEAAIREGDYPKVLRLAEEVLGVDPANATAYRRLGAAYYGLKNYDEALEALRAAARLEKDPEQRKLLASYMDAVRELKARLDEERRAAEEAAKPRPAKPKAAAAPRPAAPKQLTPLELQRLYEAGVDLYAQGRLSEAARMFERLLQHDRDNRSARRALDRIRAEMR